VKYKKISLSDITHFLIGENIEVSLLPQTISGIKAIPIEILYSCSNVDCGEIDFYEIDPVKYFQGRIKPQTRECRNCKKTMYWKYSNYTNCYTIQAIHPLKDIRINHDEKTEKKIKIIEESRTIKPVITYFLTDNHVNIPFGVLNAKGVLCIDTRKKPMQYFIIADDIKTEKDFFLNYKITSKDKKDFNKYFSGNNNLNADISDSIAPKIIGQDLPKFFAALTQHSVLYIRRTDLGILKGLFVGDSRCGKSEIILDIILQLSPIGCEYVTAETATRTGISYTLKQVGDSWEIEWGILPLCDKMLIGFDGLHAWGPEEIIQLREVLSQGFINVRRTVKADSPARVRISGALNLNQQVDTYPTRWNATWDSSILNHVDRNRWDFILVFGENDVNKEDINKRHREYKEGKLKRKIPADIWRKHVIWAWQLTPDKIKIGKDTYEKIESIVNEIHKKFSDSKIKPFTNEFFNTFEKMTVAYASLCHSTDESDNLIVMSKHADFIKEKILEYIGHLELDKVKLSEKFIPIDKLESLLTQLEDTNKEKILLYIGNNRRCKQIDIANSVGMDKGNVSKEINWFQENQLISSRTKITLTETGAQLSRKLLDVLAKKQKPKDKKVVTTNLTTNSENDIIKKEDGTISSCEYSCNNFDLLLVKITEVMQSNPAHEWEINDITQRLGYTSLDQRKEVGDALRKICSNPKNYTKIIQLDEEGMKFGLRRDINEG
jgi:DNA-binding MarR family transcriptional regulator